MTALLIGLALMNPTDDPRPSPAPAVELIAHRGESFDAPENTLAAFNLAWERGVPAVELDVHLTADGRLVCIHDATTRRTTGADLVVADSNLDQLRSLDAGSWKSDAFAGESIPTLEEALDTLPDGSRCFIEVKVGPEAVPALVRAVEASGKSPDQLPVISFNADTLAEAKRALPEHPMYFLSGFRRDEKTGEWNTTIEALIEQARALGADGLDLNYRGPFDADLLGKVRDANMGLYVWTVDDPSVARELAALGVDGVTTNRAGWMRAQLASPAP
ncbi:glycerophosphodiester phosphodiesterase [Tautonia plasticadhaerens]|uniref:Glycerophosphoryl diester phosphodiesterase n=1 Tax=Tautonia plasticadhaerens TaxID=2527974 RepID=A0A518GZ79_9BACT|nr:glycerophosphodiester phosphodiesterase [Tautonia plasticadhaerens]QDV33883.1 Glycerophosphoryl diester phosphodiesterase [Tautonia plasticadhaerens]